MRNTRVLARDAARLARAGGAAGVPGAIRLLEGAVWEFAASYDDPPRAGLARRCALAAAAPAENLEGARPELVGQVRSTAVDLVRAAELVADSDEPVERPTEELLAVTSPLSDLEHDLAERAAAVDQLERVARPLERVARADERPHGALLDQLVSTPSPISRLTSGLAST